MFIFFHSGLLYYFGINGKKSILGPILSFKWINFLTKVEETRRANFQKNLKKLNVSIFSIMKELLQLTPKFVEDLDKLLIGNIVGHITKHN